MATVTRPSGSLPDPGDLIQAAPIRDYINNILSFLESTNIDENNVDSTSLDGIATMGTAQTITGVKSFLNRSTATGAVSVMTVGRNRSIGNPSDNDIARLVIQMDNDNSGANIEMGYIDFVSTDVSNGTEDLEIRFAPMIGGTRTEHLRFGGGIGVAFNDGQADIDFRIEGDNVDNVFKVDAGTDSVGVYCNGLTFDATGRGVILLGNGTEPAALVANAIQFYAKDASGDSKSTLGIYTEEAVAVIGTFTASHKLPIWINGTEYHIQLDAV
jgi:hypothetical protein